jgi:excisionase family DNA binding protein
MSKLLKVRDVAAYYGVSVQAVYKWINEGKISTTETPGGEKRIEEEELQKISEKRG